MRTTRVVASVKFLSLYECATCGRMAQGGTQGAEFDVATFDELKARLDNVRQRAHSMPTGWASYGDKFKCPEHVT